MSSTIKIRQSHAWSRRRSTAAAVKGWIATWEHSTNALTLAVDLATAILCWCSLEIKATGPSQPALSIPTSPSNSAPHLPPSLHAKDARIIALLAYLPRWCMAPIASQTQAVFITNCAGQQPTYHCWGLGIALARFLQQVEEPGEGFLHFMFCVSVSGWKKP